MEEDHGGSDDIPPEGIEEGEDHFDVAYRQNKSGADAHQGDKCGFGQQKGSRLMPGESQLEEGSHLGGPVFDVKAEEEGRQENGGQQKKKAEAQEELAEVHAAAGRLEPFFPDFRHLKSKDGRGKFLPEDAQEPGFREALCRYPHGGVIPEAVGPDFLCQFGGHEHLGCSAVAVPVRFIAGPDPGEVDRDAGFPLPAMAGVGHSGNGGHQGAVGPHPGEGHHRGHPERAALCGKLAQGTDFIPFHPQGVSFTNPQIPGYPVADQDLPGCETGTRHRRSKRVRDFLAPGGNGIDEIGHDGSAARKGSKGLCGFPLQEYPL